MNKFIANEFIEDLEQVWDNLEWDRKFEHSTPRADILYAWHAYSRAEISEAKEILANLPEEEELEEGRFVVRSAHLGSYSDGQTIVICESDLDC